MKKVTFILLYALITLSGSGQNYSSLTVGTTVGPNLKVRFAGKQYTLQDAKATFQVLNPGTYKLQIYQLQNKPNGQEYVEVFNNDITLTAQKHLEIMVLRFGKVVWDEGLISKDDWNANYQNPTTNDRSNSQTGQAVDDDQFQKIKKAIDETSKNDKMETVKAIFKYNRFTTDQLILLSRLFESKYDKMDFAKYAYNFCLDKGSYFSMADEFTSSYDKSDLMTFINAK